MRSRRASSGFSLIEILVVITIVAIVVSVAVISIGLVSGDRELQREMQRFTARVELARDESMLQGREYGLELAVQGYRFVELNPVTRQWTDIADDETFASRQLPEFLEFDLYIEGQRIELEYDLPVLAVEEDDEDDDRSDRDEFDYRPHVFIFSSGDVTPYELHIREIYSDEVVRLEGDLFGRISLLTEDDL